MSQCKYLWSKCDIVAQPDHPLLIKKLDLNYNVHNSFISGFGFMVLCINCIWTMNVVSKAQTGFRE
jgi:hypothetical protein